MAELQPTSDPGASGTDSAPSAAGAAPDDEGAALHLLLATDRADDAVLIARLLQAAFGEGVVLRHVCDRRTALAEVASQASGQPGPDLVFVDRRGQDGDGLELVRALRRCNPPPPLIVLARPPGEAGKARGEPDVARNAAYEAAELEALHAGADESIDLRSLEPAALARIVRHALARSRGQRSPAIPPAPDAPASPDAPAAPAPPDAGDAFSYSVSHDLRAPLHVIRGFAEALRTGLVGEVDAVAGHYLGRIVENTDRMERLIAGILRQRGRR